MPQVIVTIIKSKDNKGNDVAECLPHNVTLSISDQDQIVWGSFEGNFEIDFAPGTRPLLPGGPWKGTKGQLSPPVGLNPGVEPGDFCNFVASLTPLEANEPLGLGGSILRVGK